MNEEPKEMVNVYSDDNLLIRDVKENEQRSKCEKPRYLFQM